MSTDNLPTDDLARLCADETRKFALHHVNDPQFCFELIRRALVQRDSDAFTYTYQNYASQVTNWVYTHRSFVDTGENADYFVSAAITNFYFALRGPKFEQFTSLAQVLAYLKMCVHTAIMQYLRDQQPQMTVPIDDIVEPGHTVDITLHLEARELWDRICRLLPDETDRLLADLVFIQHLKPAQIVAAQTPPWKTERDVSVALQRIRRILRKNEELREWAGVSPSQVA